MSKSKNKIIRYKNILDRVSNSGQYFLRKMIGIKDSFTFQIKGFGGIAVPKNMLGPFRENFFDDIYFRHIPESILMGRPDLTVMDIGGNVGFFALATFSKYPKAKIHSFEPHPYCFEILSNYKKEFGKFQWTIVNAAVGGQNGELTLNAATISGFATMTTVFQHDHRTESFTAKLIALDTYIEQEGITSIDVIKMDCEGGEYDILYKLPKTTFDKIKAMCIETHKGNGPKENLEALHQHLKDMGYTTLALDEGNYSGYIWAWKG